MIRTGDHVRLADGRTGWARVDVTLGLALVHLDSDDWDEATSINVHNLDELEKI